jgi:hypothetical protein
MSIQSTPAAAGLPVVNQALEPAWVRHGSATTKQDYATALGFEKLLVEQLTKSLTATSGLDGESSEAGQPGAEGGESGGPGGGTSQISSLLPQALSAGVVGAGGLGLAAQLTHELEGVHPSDHLARSGGTAA